MMQQLVVLTDLSTLPREIESNYEVVKAELSNVLKKYDGLVVTDENFKEMKTVRAEINSGIAVIKQVGTETKKRLLAPFESFDAKVKELASLAVEKRNALDVQIKEIEARRKQEKHDELVAYVQEQVAGKDWNVKLYSSLPYFTQMVDRNAQWMNATFSIAKAKAAIEAEVARCYDARNQVKSIYANDLEVVKAKAGRYLVEANFDVGAACVRINEFKAEEERLAEARRIDEERRRKAEEERRAREAEQARLRAEAEERSRIAEQERLRREREAEEERRAAAARTVVNEDTSRLPPVPQQDPMSAAKAALRAARAGIVQPAHSPEPPVASAEPPAPAPAPASLAPKVYAMTLRFTATLAQMHHLKDYMRGEGIGYEVLDEPKLVSGAEGA